jgi:hypothetical protein
MIEVISTSFLRQPTHILEGFGVISIPQTQHNIVGIAPYSSAILRSLLLGNRSGFLWRRRMNGGQGPNLRYHGRDGKEHILVLSGAKGNGWINRRIDSAGQDRTRDRTRDIPSVSPISLPR